MIDSIKEIIEPIIQEDGAELVEMIYGREAGKQVLRLLVDKEGGIQMADCVRLNKKISQALDVGTAHCAVPTDIMQGSYVLEVDSPGIGRLFKIKRDYERAAGRLVRVTLNEAIAEKKEHIGRIEEVSERYIRVNKYKKGIIEIPFEKIIRAREEVEFAE